jgi:hypothetical protein
MNWLRAWGYGLANSSNSLNDASASFSSGPDTYVVGYARKVLQLARGVILPPRYGRETGVPCVELGLA